MSTQLENDEPKQRTIRQWLETLPPGYRERAIANHENSPIVEHANREPSCLSYALDLAFNWEMSPEEEDFWSDVFIHYDQNKKPLPPLPESVKPKNLGYTGHTPCRKCGKTHWMHGPCDEPKPASEIRLPVSLVESVECDGHEWIIRINEVKP